MAHISGCCCDAAPAPDPAPDPGTGQPFTVNLGAQPGGPVGSYGPNHFAENGVVFDGGYDGTFEQDATYDDPDPETALLIQCGGGTPPYRFAYAWRGAPVSGATLVPGASPFSAALTDRNFSSLGLVVDRNAAELGVRNGSILLTVHDAAGGFRVFLLHVRLTAVDHQ